MAQVDILEIQVKDNAYRAAAGLERLGRAMEQLNGKLNVGAISSLANAMKQLNTVIGDGKAFAKFSEGIKRMSAAFGSFSKLSEGDIGETAGKIAQAVEDLQRAFSDQVDVQGLSGLTAVSNVFNGLGDSITGISKTMSKLNEGSIGKIVGNFAELYGGIAEVASQQTGISQSSMDIANLASSIAQLKIAMHGVNPSEIKKILNAMNSGSVGGANRSNGWSNFLKAIPGMKMLRRFFNMTILRGMREIIRSIFKSLNEGLQNFYKYSKKHNPAVAKNLDLLAGAGAKLSNAFGAAAESLLSALAPALIQIANIATTVINTFSQLIALLSGRQSWTQAIDYATSFGQAATGAGHATKDWLADFDELNVMDNGNGGGGGGGSSGNPGNMFTENTEFSEWMLWIKDHLQDIQRMAIVVGAAFLAWKLSPALNGAFGRLGQLLSGIVVTLGSIVLQWDANASIIADGFNVGNIIEKISGYFLAYFGVNALMPGKPLSFKLGLTFALSGALTLAQSIMDSRRNGVTMQNLQSYILSSVQLGLGVGLLSGNWMFGLGIGIAITSIALAFQGGQQILDATDALQDADGMLKLIGGSIAAGLGLAVIGIGFGLPFLPAAIAGVALGFTVGVIASVILHQIKTDRELKQQAIQVLRRSGLNGKSVNAALGEVRKAIQSYIGGVVPVDLNVRLEVNQLSTDVDWALYGIDELLHKYKHAPDELTAQDKERWKSLWNTVLDGFDRIDKANFSSLFDGITQAMRSANSDIAEQAIEMRKNLLMVQQGLSANQARHKVRLEELTDKMFSGVGLSDEQMAQMTNLTNYFSQIGDEAGRAFDQAVSKSISFEDTDQVVDYLNQVKAAADEAQKVLQQTYDERKKAYESEIWSIDAQVAAGILDSTVAEQYKQVLTGAFGLVERDFKTRMQGIDQTVSQAFENAANQAFTARPHISEKTYEAYVQSVLNPIYDTMSELLGQDLANNIRRKLNKLDAVIPVTVDLRFGRSVMHDAGGGNGSILSGTLNDKLNFSMRASGGMVNTGEMFLARENGPELVGRIGNKSAVANNEQIIEGISSGVSAANAGNEALLAQLVTIGRQLLTKESNVVIQPSAALGRTMNRSNDLYSRVTG